MNMAMSATAPASSPPASRTLVIAGFILATLFSGAVTLGVGLAGASYQASRVERAAQVDKFVESAQAFDPLVKRFAAEVKVGTLTPGTKASIRENLGRQRATLESVMSVAPEASRPLADRYMEALGRADGGIKEATGKLDSREFAQGAADIAAQRPDLYEALRHHPLI